MRLKYIAFFCLLLICSSPVLSKNNFVPNELIGANITAPGFEENKGQITDENGKPVPNVLFRVAVNGSYLFVTKTGLSFVFIESIPDSSSTSKQKKENKQHFKSSRFDMHLAGANINNVIVENQLNTARFDYYNQNYPEGITHVKTYKKIIVQEIYKGIDWHLYFDNANNLKHDFVIHPGANPKQIKIQYEGERSLKIAADKKSLEISGHMGLVNEGGVYSYQPFNMAEVETRFHVSEDKSVSYEIGNYNKNEELIIDPPLKLWWSTYLGGSQNDVAEAIATDNSGNVFVTGWGYASGVFPTLNPGGTTYFSTVGLLFVSKFNNAGVLLWSTFFGSNFQDVRGFSVAVDPTGNVYIGGYASFSSSGPNTMPTLALTGAYNQPGFGGGDYDAILLKFSNTGTLLWATYYGGNGDDQTHDVCTDAAGNVYMTGFTLSTNFPLANPGGGAYYQNTFGGVIIFIPGLTLDAGDAFMVKFDVAGSNVWSTYLGGNHYDKGIDIEVDATGNIYLVGHTASNNFPLANVGATYFSQATYAGGVGLLAFYGDVFVTKFSSSYNLLWSTYYGGNDDDCATGVEVDGLGNIWVSGHTRSTNFPVVNLPGAYNQAALGGSVGLEDFFIIKFNPAASTVLWSTYYGGGRDDVAEDMTIDECGNIYIVGGTSSTDFPLSANPGSNYFFDNSFNGYGVGGVQADIQIMSLSNAGVVQWASYFGGADNETGLALCLDNKGAVFVAGRSGKTVTIPPLVNPGGGAYYNNVPGGMISGTPDDGIIIKFIPDSLLLSPATSASLSSNISCFGNNDGKATVIVGGGTAPYVYSWNTTPSQSTSSITGLAAGSYTVEVRDENCSIDTLSFIITQPAQLQLSLSAKNNVLCNGDSTGFASVLQSGGTAPYSYSWLPINNTNSSVSGLAAGSYTIEVTDTNGCYTNTIVSITQTSPILLNPSKADILCNGNNTGIISINHSGGVLPFAYSWNNGSTSHLLTGLAAGTYSVSITDSLGCAKDTSVILTEPPLITYVLSSTSASCNQNNGQAQIVAAGGTPTYTYSWNNGSTTSSISALAPNTYSVTITDSNGCTSQTSITVNSSAFTSTLTSVPISCENPNSGALTAVITTGTSLYNYSWSTGQTTQGISNLSQGSYTLTISDSLGCEQVHVIQLTQPPQPVANAGANDTVCIGSIVSLGASGGTSYLWSTGQTTQNITTSPITSNSVYTVTVSIGNCTDIDSVLIAVAQNPVLVVNNDTTIQLGSDVIITAANSLGGNATYLWSTGETTSSININPIETTTYYITITNEYGCSTTDSIVITVENICDENIFVPNAFSPNADGQNDVLQIFHRGYTESFYLAIYNRWGEKIFETNDINTWWDGTHHQKPLDTGVYSYVLKYYCSVKGDELAKVGNVSLLR